MPYIRFALSLSRRRIAAGLLVVLAVAVVVVLSAVEPPVKNVQAATSDHLMCAWKAQQRPQTVSIDPYLSSAGLSQDDVLSAFQPWNDLFLRYHGFPIFVSYEGDWQDADVLLTAHGWSRTWVDGQCNPGYRQRGANQSIVFVGSEDAWRNRDLLRHELGHALGFADHGPSSEFSTGHMGYKPCGSYIGVMSYCASPQTWFLDYDGSAQGILLDGQLIRDYWQP